MNRPRRALAYWVIACSGVSLVFAGAAFRDWWPRGGSPGPGRGLLLPLGFFALAVVLAALTRVISPEIDDRRSRDADLLEDDSHTLRLDENGNEIPDSKRPD